MTEDRTPYREWASAAKIGPIERVARAVQDRLFQPTPDMARYVDIRGTPEQIAATYRELTDAILAALREPSEAMIDAGHENMSVARGDVATIWQSMIDAALAANRG